MQSTSDHKTFSSESVYPQKCHVMSCHVMSCHVILKLDPETPTYFVNMLQVPQTGKHR